MSMIEQINLEIVKALASLRKGLVTFLFGLALLIFCWYTMSVYIISVGDKAPFWLAALGYIGFIIMILGVREFLEVRIRTKIKDPELEENPTIQRLKYLKEAYADGLLDDEEYAAKRSKILNEM